MRINRAALRKAVTDALAADKQLHAEAVTAWVDFEAEHRQKWVEENNPRWTEAVKKINRKVRAGKPIIMDDLPRARDWSSTIATYSPPQRDGRRNINNPGPYRPHPGLVALGVTLDLIEDDVVSTTALHAVGITGAAVRDALQFLAKVEGKAARDAA